MKKHKYVILGCLDYTEILGKSFQELIPDISLSSKDVDIVEVTSKKMFKQPELDIILNEYKKGMQNFKLPSGVKVNITKIRYDGIVDMPQEEPNEINLLDTF
jgi:hypothetical protein